MPRTLTTAPCSLYPPLERHYNSDLSIWLSVDPMSDKYPSTSPYAYCANNPVKLVDPNGREIYEFDENGKYLGVRKGSEGTPDQIAINKSDGTISYSQKYANGTIRLGPKGEVKQNNGNPINVQTLKIKGDDNALNCFKFIADNSNVEWSLARVGASKGDKGINFISNSQENDFEHSISLYTNKNNIREHWHSHTNGSLIPSRDDYETSEMLRSRYGNIFETDGYIPTYIYSKGRYERYSPFIKMLDGMFNEAWDHWENKRK